jgi:hypothetical protein
MSTTKTTLVQDRRVEELQDDNGRPRIYTEPLQGKTIVGQFRRYVTQEDAEQIGHALYDFLKGTCGFIAEYGLIPPDGGFRIKWAEPADLMGELANGISGGAARRGHAQIVYADGITDVEVLAAVDKIADEQRAACAEGRARRAFDREISVAIRCLEPHGFTIVPPGWRLATEKDAGGGAQQERPGSLAHALVQLAARNGMTLIAPPAVEPDGQVRLL